MIDFIVIKILIALLSANRLEAERFELINVSSLFKIAEKVVNTYVLPELLMSAVGTHELRTRGRPLASSLVLGGFTPTTSTVPGCRPAWFRSCVRWMG